MTKDSPPSNTTNSSRQGDSCARWRRPSSVQRSVTERPQRASACSDPATRASVQCTARAAATKARQPQGAFMAAARPRISVFPKCYFDELVRRERSYTDWIRQAATLGAEGVEHYDGFFDSQDEPGVAPVRRAVAESGQVSSMLCFSPDFTHP